MSAQRITTGVPTPPFRGETAPRSVCARWMGDSPCGALATMHIIWALDMKNGPVCPEHDEEACRRWVFVGRHPYMTACREGARWDPSLDICEHPAEQGISDQQIGLLIDPAGAGRQDA